MQMGVDDDVFNTEQNCGCKCSQNLNLDRVQSLKIITRSKRYDS